MKQTIGHEQGYESLSRSRRREDQVISPANITKLQQALRTQGEVKCDETTGMALDLFKCSKINIVGFMSIKDLGSNLTSPNVPFGFASDVWGWTDSSTKKEYALAGVWDGVSVVDITKPSKPKLVGFLPTTVPPVSGYWSEMKTFGNVAYIVHEEKDHGVQVLNMARVVKTKSVAGTTPILKADVVLNEVGNVHNLVVAAKMGYLLAVGMSSTYTTNPLCVSGMAAWNIKGAKSVAPQYVGCLFPEIPYVHDAVCDQYKGPDKDHYGQHICVLSAVTEIIFVNLGSRKIISRGLSYPGVGFVHQSWMSEDQTQLFHNDEEDELLRTNGLNGESVNYIFDIRDLDKPVLLTTVVNKFKSIDHNNFVKGNYIYHANYGAGIQIRRILGLGKVEEVSFIDLDDSCPDVCDFSTCEIEPTPDSCECYSNPKYFCDVFSGTWGIFPYFESGTLVTSTSYDGLFLLKSAEKLK